MDGVNVPYVWLPGYQATISGYEPWTRVPDLHFVQGGRQVYLSADHESYRYSYYAVPQSRE